MKRLNELLLLFFIVFFGSCEEKIVESYTYNTYDPVYMSATEFRNSVRVIDQPQEIREKGKICFYKDYLFISETGKGIHIINNTNPISPRKVGYIELLGNNDLIIKENVLYADAFIDLVYFDVSNPSNPVLSGRLEGVFLDAIPVCEEGYIPYYYYSATGDKPEQIVIGWDTSEKRVEKVYYRKKKWFGGKDDIYLNAEASGGGSSNGLVGSMSRFGLYKDYLYAIGERDLSIFNVSASEPVLARERMPIGWDIETIFPYKDNLFMGTRDGLLIYSVENPLEPEYQSVFRHVYACDPVVVENDIAYVTIRSENWCGQDNNELFIVDVSNVKHPKQIVSYTMKGPKGLGIDNGTLFVCDDGLKIFDAENPQTIMANMLFHTTQMDGYDVIPYNNILMMIAEDGIYQYDYSDLQNIKELSRFSFK